MKKLLLLFLLLSLVCAEQAINAEIISANQTTITQNTVPETISNNATLSPLMDNFVSPQIYNKYFKGNEVYPQIRISGYEDLNFELYKDEENSGELQHSRLINLSVKTNSDLDVYYSIYQEPTGNQDTNILQKGLCRCFEKL